MTCTLESLITETSVKFGTSGVRGLVNEMTDLICFGYMTAFLSYLDLQGVIPKGGRVGIAGDLRDSSPRIMKAMVAACHNFGYTPLNLGFIPSPAVVLFGMKEEIPTVVVTGSHIPDDRNGIKFNTPIGEILKDDEVGINEQKLKIPFDLFTGEGMLKQNIVLPSLCSEAEQNYISRFIEFFPKKCFKGKRIGLYEHSSVARGCVDIILREFGATVFNLGRSENFVPVDTEAIRDEDVTLAKKWVKEYGLDCIISTDGDGDRPLISDEFGTWLRGDIAGLLCAFFMEADTVVTPVSSNSVVEKSRFFQKVVRTKIGSPYVIEAMHLADIEKQCVVGYEANGGFLQQSNLYKGKKKLRSLPTRDAVIVALSVVFLACSKKVSISELLSFLPRRFTHSDRLKNFPTNLSDRKLAKIVPNDIDKCSKAIREYFPKLGPVKLIDSTDGIRITLENEDIVHIRASGNAPELRCYTEASEIVRAETLNNYCISVMKSWL